MPLTGELPTAPEQTAPEQPAPEQPTSNEEVLRLLEQFPQFKKAWSQIEAARTGNLFGPTTPDGADVIARSGTVQDRERLIGSMTGNYPGFDQRIAELQKELPSPMKRTDSTWGQLVDIGGNVIGKALSALDLPASGVERMIGMAYWNEIPLADRWHVAASTYDTIANDMFSGGRSRQHLVDDYYAGKSLDTIEEENTNVWADMAGHFVLDPMWLIGGIPLITKVLPAGAKATTLGRLAISGLDFSKIPLVRDVPILGKIGADIADAKLMESILAHTEGSTEVLNTGRTSGGIMRMFQLNPSGRVDEVIGHTVALFNNAADPSLELWDEGAVGIRSMLIDLASDGNMTSNFAGQYSSSKGVRTIRQFFNENPGISKAFDQMESLQPLIPGKLLNDYWKGAEEALKTTHNGVETNIVQLVHDGVKLTGEEAARYAAVRTSYFMKDMIDTAAPWMHAVMGLEKPDLLAHIDNFSSGLKGWLSLAVLNNPRFVTLNYNSNAFHIALKSGDVGSAFRYLRHPTRLSDAEVAILEASGRTVQDMRLTSGETAMISDYMPQLEGSLKGLGGLQHKIVKKIGYGLTFANKLDQGARDRTYLAGVVAANHALWDFTGTGKGILPALPAELLDLPDVVHAIKALANGSFKDLAILRDAVHGDELITGASVLDRAMVQIAKDMGQAGGENILRTDIPSSLVEEFHAFVEEVKAVRHSGGDYIEHMNRGIDTLVGDLDLLAYRQYVSSQMDLPPIPYTAVTGAVPWQDVAHLESTAMTTKSVISQWIAAHVTMLGEGRVRRIQSSLSREIETVTTRIDDMYESMRGMDVTSGRLRADAMKSITNAADDSIRAVYHELGDVSAETADLFENTLGIPLRMLFNEMADMRLGQDAPNAMNKFRSELGTLHGSEQERLAQIIKNTGLEMPKDFAQPGEFPMSAQRYAHISSMMQKVLDHARTSLPEQFKNSMPLTGEQAAALRKYIDGTPAIDAQTVVRRVPRVEKWMRDRAQQVLNDINKRAENLRAELTRLGNEQNEITMGAAENGAQELAEFHLELLAKQNPEKFRTLSERVAKEITGDPADIENIMRNADEALRHETAATESVQRAVKDINDPFRTVANGVDRSIQIDEHIAEIEESLERFTKIAERLGAVIKNPPEVSTVGTGKQEILRTIADSKPAKAAPSPAQVETLTNQVKALTDERWGTTRPTAGRRQFIDARLKELYAELGTAGHDVAAAVAAVDSGLRPPAALPPTSYSSAGEGGLFEAMRHRNMIAETHGRTIRDWSMLNYSRKYGIDGIMQMVFPYSFWASRSMVDWGKMTLARPGVTAASMRLYAGITEINENEGLPARLKSMIHIPVPFFDDMLTGPAGALGMQGERPDANGIYFDPIRQLFPLAGQMDKTDYDRNLKGLTPLGRVFSFATQAAPFGVNPLITGVLGATGALGERDTFVRRSIASMTDTPFGIPGPRLARAIHDYFAGINDDPDPEVLDARTKLALAKGEPLPEKQLKSWYEAGWDYAATDGFDGFRIDRVIAGLVANDPHRWTPRAGTEAMKFRQGPLFEEARKQAGTEKGLAALTGWLAMPVRLYPEGEQIQKGLDAMYREVLASKDSGDISNFFKRYPEYQLRNAAYADSPASQRGLLDTALFYQDIGKVGERYDPHIDQLRATQRAMEDKGMLQTKDGRREIEMVKLDLKQLSAMKQVETDKLGALYPNRDTELTLRAAPHERALADMREEYYAIKASDYKTIAEFYAAQEAFKQRLPVQSSASAWIAAAALAIATWDTAGERMSQRPDNSAEIKAARDKKLTALTKQMRPNVSRDEFQSYLTKSQVAPTKAAEEYEKARNQLDGYFAIAEADGLSQASKSALSRDFWARYPLLQKYFGNDEPVAADSVSAAVFGQMDKVWKDYYALGTNIRGQRDYMAAHLEQLNKLRARVGLRPVKLKDWSKTIAPAPSLTPGTDLTPPAQ